MFFNHLTLSARCRRAFNLSMMFAVDRNRSRYVWTRESPKPTAYVYLSPPTKRPHDVVVLERVRSVICIYNVGR